MEVALQWEFEWPYLHGNASLSDIKQNDLFVPDGGSVTYAAKDDLYYVAYTYVCRHRQTQTDDRQLRLQPVTAAWVSVGRHPIRRSRR